PPRVDQPGASRAGALDLLGAGPRTAASARPGVPPGDARGPRRALRRVRDGEHRAGALGHAGGGAPAPDEVGAEPAVLPPARLALGLEGALRMRDEALLLGQDRARRGRGPRRPGRTSAGSRP